MAYPCLIPKWAFNKLVEVYVAGDGVSEDGELLPQLSISQKCNIQLKSEQKLDEKRQSVRLTGKAFFEGDMCPDIRIIKGGKLVCDGIEYNIHAGSKALNFDGTVNYTELELV